MTTPGKTRTLIKYNHPSSSQAPMTTNGRRVDVAIRAVIAAMGQTSARASNANTVKSAEKIASAMISVRPMTAT